jgi:ATP-dependent DNA helicase RecG
VRKSGERRILFDYLTADALLGRFFDPFIFENLPAIDHSTSAVFTKEVEHSDIYPDFRTGTPELEFK